MTQVWESAVEPFQRGQSASEHFAEQLGQIGTELAATGEHLPRIAAMLRLLRSAQAFLRRPLRIALLGEANVGKSTLTNLLLGNAVIPTLQLSNTRIPTLIRYGAQPAVSAVFANGRALPLNPGDGLPSGMICAAVDLPIAHLRAAEILDFPGFSDPWLGYRHSDVARHGIDAPLWCTFSTQAWKESERAIWSGLPRRMREHALLAVTNGDLLRDEQAEKVIARLEKVAPQDFRGIALLSSSKALQALDRNGAVQDDVLWHQSGAPGLLDQIGAMLLAIRRDRLRRVQAFVAKSTGKALHHLKSQELSA